MPYTFVWERENVRFCALWFLFAHIAMAAPGGPSWKTIQAGVDYSSMAVSGGRLYVVRVDPAVAKITVGLASETKGQARTAAEWCRTAKLAVAINAGMFQTDQRSNVGYLRHGTHLNNPKWNDYRSVVAVRPGKVIWLDIDEPKDRERTATCDLVIQNLRLMTTKRANVWSANERRWSEAALAVDHKGRLLFLFSRAPYAMRDFTNLLLTLPLDIAGAMHLEGGPEASLSIHGGGVDLDLAGSYETGFWDDSNDHQWAIPNVLGVAK